jgi:hypothetical protein
MNYQQIPFARASRDARIDGLPVSRRLRRLIRAVDVLAPMKISAGDPDAFYDDGQVLVARLSLGELARAIGCSDDTVSRAIDDARRVTDGCLDVTDGRGRSYVFWLHWLRIPPAADCGGEAAGPPAIAGGHAVGQTRICGGPQIDLRGAADRFAGGRNSKPPKNTANFDPPQHPPQFLRDSEKEINNLRASSGSGSFSVSALSEVCGGPQPGELLGAAGEPDDGSPGFFSPALSDDRPWQRLDDSHLVTLDRTMLCVLYAEAVAQNWIRDTHDTRKRFLALAYHCARTTRVEGRARLFVGRFKRGNYQGLHDAAWQWANAELDAGRKPRGFGAAVNAAIEAKLESTSRNDR